MPFNPQPSSPAPAAGGFDLGGLVSAFTGGGGAGGASAGGANTLGSTLGSVGAVAFGPLGSIAGNLIGSVVGSFGSGPYRSGGARFDGKHSAGRPEISAGSYEDGMAEVIAWYSDQMDIGVEEIVLIMNTDLANHPGGTFQGVGDAYASRRLDGSGVSNATGWMNRYNASNPQTPIRLGSRSNPASSANPMPVSVNSYQSYSGNTGIVGPAAMNFGNDPQNPSAPTMRDYLNGIMNGAVQGGGKVFGNTPQGQQMQNDGAKQWLGNNWYLPAAVASVLAVFGYMAFKKK